MSAVSTPQPAFQPALRRLGHRYKISIKLVITTLTGRQHINWLLHLLLLLHTLMEVIYFII